MPNKNWREIAGKPLFAHSVLAAVNSKLFSAIVVSSDAPEILNRAVEFGATHVVERPAELSTDSAGKVPAIVHAVRQVEAMLDCEFDTVVDLDATSPLREYADILAAVSLLERSNSSSVVTATESRRSPYFNLIEFDPEKGLWATSKRSIDNVLRRQDARKTFDMNASIYVWRRGDLIKNPKVFYASTKVFEMPQERSLDIDTEFDFEIVKWLMEKRTK